MEVKLGYKQTEVGVIPEDWQVKQIQNICRLVNGRGFKPFEWQTVGLPIIRIQNLNGSDDFNFYSGQYNPKILVEHGQLLFAWSGSRGTSFGPHVWTGGRALLNYHTWKVVVNESNVTSDFLFYGLRQLTNYIEERAHGASALVHTQKWEMEKFLIVVPASLSEQCAIATALRDADVLLDSLQRLIAKKRDLKLAAMQQLLTGQTRLPGFNSEWVSKRLGEICGKITTGKLDANAMVPDGDYPFFTCARENYWIDRFAFDCEALLVSGNGANVGYVHHYKGKFNAYQRTYVMSQFSEDILFTKWFLVRNIQERIRVEVNAGNTPYITMGTLTEMPVILPPTVPEQVAIAAILTDMDSELQVLEQRLAKTRDLKQGMMQELLTGRTRLV